MRHCLLAVAPFLLLLGCATGSDPSATSKGEILAEGQGVEVAEEEIRRELARMSEEARELVLSEPKKLQEVITQIYFRSRMTVLAEERGYLKDEDVQFRLERARRNTLTRIVPELYYQEADKPDFEQKARAYYEENLEKFVPQEQLRLSHILLEAQDPADKKRRRPEAEKILAALEDGAEFADMAREHSDDGSQYMGGSLGRVKRGQLVPEFEKAAFALEEEGSISDVVPTRYGLHIIKLHERTPAEPKPFDEVRDPIVEKLREEHRREVLQAWLAEEVPPEKAAVEEERLQRTQERLKARFAEEGSAGDGLPAAKEPIAAPTSAGEVLED
jgi:peptidyl-prolyl cis-trans isomerase C